MTQSNPSSSRRNFLLAAGTTGMVGAAVAAAPVSFASAPGATTSRRFDVDVAIYVDTFTLIPAAGSAPPLAGYGTVFIVEGGMFEGGALPEGENIDTAAHDDALVGTWFCRGWFINTLDRPDPHIISHQDFIFDSDLMTPNTIVTSGVEGNNDTAAVFYRAVTGGTGEFAFANGQTVYGVIGTNTRLGTNLRFGFDITVAGESADVKSQGKGPKNAKQSSVAPAAGGGAEQSGSLETPAVADLEQLPVTR